MRNTCKFTDETKLVLSVKAILHKKKPNIHTGKPAKQQGEQDTRDRPETMITNESHETKHVSSHCWSITSGLAQSRKLKMNSSHKIHFRDLQVGLSKSSYLKFGIIFNHAFLSLPQPQQYFGVFCRKPKSSSLGEEKKKKKASGKGFLQHSLSES